MSAWKAFYEGREGHGYLEYVKERYAPFINAIHSRIRSRDLVLEIGCGTGTISKALSEKNTSFLQSRVEFCASDMDPEMVLLTRSRLSKDNVAVFELDALSNLGPRADVVHSHGMLEHFSDDTIRAVIDNHSQARVQVHYVPGEYAEPTFGDERLLPVKAWWEICKPDQIITFNGGLDYALIFERT